MQIRIMCVVLWDSDVRWSFYDVCVCVVRRDKKCAVIVKNLS